MCVAYAQARTHTAHPHVRACVLSENSNSSGGRTPTEPQTTRHTTHNAVTQNEQSDLHGLTMIQSATLTITIKANPKPNGNPKPNSRRNP